MLACTTSEVTLSRWDCSITLDISTAESADSRVRNLAFAAEIGAGDDEDASDNDDVGDRSGKSEGSGAVSLLHLAGGVRASHGIVQGRGCFEVYIKAVSACMTVDCVCVAVDVFVECCNALRCDAMRHKD